MQTVLIAIFGTLFMILCIISVIVCLHEELTRPDPDTEEGRAEIARRNALAAQREHEWLNRNAKRDARLAQLRREKEQREEAERQHKLKMKTAKNKYNAKLGECRLGPGGVARGTRSCQEPIPQGN